MNKVLNNYNKSKRINGTSKCEIGTTLHLMDKNKERLSVGDIVRYGEYQGVLLYNHYYDRYGIALDYSMWYGDDKYNIDFALKKDKSGEIPKYLVFFKARDADALTAAFKEYTAKTDRKKEKPSILKKLRRFKDMSATLDTPKVRKKELDAR